MSTARLRRAGLASYMAAALAAGVFVASYAYGFFRQNLVWDVDPPWWTFTNPCNAGYDLVPSWVTPTAWTSFTLCVVLRVAAVVLRVVARKRSAARAADA